MSLQPESTPANILVVDDTPANLQLLTSMLKDRGYRVRPVSSGEMALRAIEVQIPDLILLDITMPGMDGYEVCSQLKTNPRWRDIPILFISALNDTKDKIRAFQAGGVDYVSKPFQIEEVEARVNTHLELRRQRTMLQQTITQLHELERLRDSLIHMIVHDMKSPLTVVRLAIETLTPPMDSVSPEDVQMVAGARHSINTLIDMTNQMLDISRLEAGQMQLVRTPTNLNELVGSSLENLRLIAGHRHLSSEADEVLLGSVDAEIIRRVVANLVVNAIKFTNEPEGKITVRLAKEGTLHRISVCDNGIGIEPAFLGRIFDKFAQADTLVRRSGSGLGLTFVKMAVEAHGGQVRVESVPGRGSVFSFTIPSA